MEAHTADSIQGQGGRSDMVSWNPVWMSYSHTSSLSRRPLYINRIAVLSLPAGMPVISIFPGLAKIILREFGGKVFATVERSQRVSQAWGSKAAEQ